LARSIKRKKGDEELEISSPNETPTTNSEESLKQIPEEAENKKTSEPEDIIKEGGISVSDTSDEKELRNEMFLAVYRHNDREAFNKAFEKLANFPDRIITDEDLLSTKHEYELKLGVLKAEQDLIELEESNPEWTQPSLKLATFYISISSLDKAENHLGKVFERLDAGENTIYAKELLAQIREKKGDPSSAIAILNGEADNEEHPSERRAHFLDKIADIHERNENIIEMQIALEKGLLLDPSNKLRRFRIAYSYAKNEGKTPLAFWHYSILLNQDRMHTSALHNIGLIYRNYGIKGKGIEYWLRAANIPDTHTIGNIASALIGEGFFSKAREYLDSVPDKEKISPRINEVANSLENKIKEEEETSKKLDRTANFHRRFVEKRLEKSSLNPADIEISGSWKSSAGETLNIDLSQDSNSISGTATPRFSGLNQPEKKLDLKGEIDGNYIEIQAIDNTPRGQTFLTIGSDKTRHYRLLLRSENKLEGLSWVEILNAGEIVLTKEN